MKINSNIQAMITNSILKKNEEQYSHSTERLSSGYRINSAKDSPAGIAITNKMNSQIRSMKKANQNTTHAVNVVQTAEGALSEIQDMIQRINELATKAASGTNTSTDRGAIQDEVNQLKSEITRVATQTEYNTQKLLDGEQALKGYVMPADPSNTASVTQSQKAAVRMYNELFSQGKYNVEIQKTGDTYEVKTAAGSEKEFESTAKIDIHVGESKSTITVTNQDSGELKFDIDNTIFNEGNPAKFQLDLKGIGGMKIQVGTEEDQEIRIVIPNVSLENMGIEDMDMRTVEGAREALDQIKGALDFVSNIRSQLGAFQNRFENTESYLNVAEENLTSSYSTIKDVDMAEEMVEYTKNQILVQAGTTMLTQANEQPQQALQLLQ